MGNSFVNGPAENLIFWDLISDTGLSGGYLNEHFTPTSNTSICENKNWLGFSHAHFKRYADKYGSAGIGVYTHSRPKPVGGGLAFFQPYDQYGDHARSNQYIQGTFVSHQCYKNNCPSSEVFYHFGAGGNNFDKLRVAFISEQGLVKFHLENPSRQQVRQQITVNFHNAKDNTQIAYSMINAINGVYSNLDTSGATHINADPSQNRLVYVAGVIGGTGISTAYNGISLWTSWGESTAKSTWNGQKKFQVEISFNQFLNALKIATSKKTGKTINQVTETDIVKFYGSNYRNPKEWTISSFSFSHEIYNPDFMRSQSFVGGNLTRFTQVSINH